MAKNSNIDMSVIGHSLSHIMTLAVKSLYGEDIKLGVGPAIDNGFYQDFDYNISAHQLMAIEQKMREIISSDIPFETKIIDLEEAREIFVTNNQPYKVELLDDIKNKGTTKAQGDISQESLDVQNMTKSGQVSLSILGTHIDLCRGGHVYSTKDLQGIGFSLDRVAGAYWRGDEHRAMLTRIYGLCFPNDSLLKEYQEQRELSRQNDHRILGEQMAIFSVNENVGPGLPLMLPRGERIKHFLSMYMRSIEENSGYQYVSTPVLSDERLYNMSGHSHFYSEDMYKIIDKDDNKIYVKPMNCPHHHMIYKKLVTSYRDLPLRLSEHAGLYRYEMTGALSGLIRVRGPITQNDSHTYIPDGLLHDEFLSQLDMFIKVYEEFNIKDYWFRLSLPDFNKDKFEGDKQSWQRAADTIETCLKEKNLPYNKEIGEAAFYGPKLDVQIKNINGKEDTIATIQIDVLIPSRMDLTFVDSTGEKQHPIILHKSILGSLERFMGFYLEKTAGHLNYYLAPEQVRVLVLGVDNEQVKEYIKEVRLILDDIVYTQPLIYKLKYSIDDSSESLSKKIRFASEYKIPYQLIIGPRDATNRQISVRTIEGEQTISLADLSSFLQDIDWRS